MIVLVHRKAAECAEVKRITIYFLRDLCVLSEAGGGYLQIFKR